MTNKEKFLQNLKEVPIRRKTKSKLQSKSNPIGSKEYISFNQGVDSVLDLSND